MGEAQKLETRRGVAKVHEKNVLLAKGFYNGDRALLDQQWKVVARELTSIGPSNEKKYPSA